MYLFFFNRFDQLWGICSLEEIVKGMLSKDTRAWGLLPQPFKWTKKTKRTCWLKLYPIFLWHLLMQANAIIAEHRNMECYASLSSPRLERRITLLCGSQNFFFPCKGFFKVFTHPVGGSMDKGSCICREWRKIVFANLGYINEIWFDNVKGCEPMR